MIKSMDIRRINNQRYPYEILVHAHINFINECMVWVKETYDNPKCWSTDHYNYHPFEFRVNQESYNTGILTIRFDDEEKTAAFKLRWV